MEHLGGYVTNGSYFIYKGVRYGHRTRFNFTDEFVENVKVHVQPGTFSSLESYVRRVSGRHQKTASFHSIEEVDGKYVFRFGDPLIVDRFVDFVPERDIAKIVTPVYYLTPKEMVKHRLKNGSWILYVWKQTLVYVICLLISPLFKQWYIIWTTGLYLYLRLCYIELSRGEIHEIPR